MDYVTYDQNGTLTGAYLQDLHPDHADNCIQVTDEQRMKWTLYRANAARDGIELAPVVAPPVVVPKSVAMRNARRALYAAGLLETVEGIIGAMEGEAGDLARIDWATAVTVRRDDPLVMVVIPALGKSEAEIDQMFIDAEAMG